MQVVKEQVHTWGFAQKALPMLTFVCWSEWWMERAFSQTGHISHVDRISCMLADPKYLQWISSPSWKRPVKLPSHSSLSFCQLLPATHCWQWLSSFPPAPNTKHPVLLSYLKISQPKSESVQSANWTLMMGWNCFCTPIMGWSCNQYPNQLKHYVYSIYFIWNARGGRRWHLLHNV